MAFENENSASGLNGDDVQGTGNDARVALLNSINDQNDAQRAEELVAINDDGSTEEFVVEHADGTQEALTDDTVTDPVAEKELQRMADEVNEEPQAPQKVKIKVNGKELELTQEELVERAQKVEAADQYLKEAARLRHEQAQRLAQEQDQTQQTEQADDDLALARAIQMGSEEEAVAALRKLRNVTPSLTKDEIAKTIDERLTFNEAISLFRKEYSDIHSDPVLKRLAEDTDNKLIAAGDQRPYIERYRDIGETLRDWMNKQVAARAPKPQQGEDKLKKKAELQPTPKSASTKSASSVEEEKEPSTSEVIAAIAQARGGPQWMQGVTRH